ncbi:MAG: rhodanese domain-containing protein [Chloroflexi bacterium OLB13]|nr:MAG: rhodanese domain-containing protein [Chloroflexi bacterium OLB13]
MAKQSKTRKANARLPLLLIAAVGAALIVAAAALFAGRGAPAVETGARMLSPSGYRAQFGDNTPHVLLDVRTPAEFAEGHIPGAVNIPVDALQSRLSEVPSDVPVVVYCRSGNRSATASQILDRAGYETVYDLGGIIAWSAQGLPVTSD